MNTTIQPNKVPRVIFTLDQILKMRKMTQKDLASVSGVSEHIISRVANQNQEQIALKTLRNLAGALGIQPGELIAFEKD